MPPLRRRQYRAQDRKSPRPSKPLSHLQKLLHQLHHHRETFWSNWQQQERQIEDGATDSMNQPYQPKPGTVNIWQNDKKSEGAPQFTTRELTIEGIEGTFEISLWGEKLARNGKKFFTAKVKKVVPREQWKAPASQPSRHEEQKANGYQSSNTYVGGDDDDWDKPL